MKLREAQAKAIFARRGIRIPRGEVVDSARAAQRVARSIGAATVIKPQLGIKGRGKVGGIGFADTPEQAAREAARLLGSRVRGELVERLLVEERVAIERELYLAVVVDYSARRPVLMASTRGGVDIEEVARKSPDEIIKVPCSLLAPPSDEQLAPVAAALGEPARAVARALYEVFCDYEAELAEVNPLVATADGSLLVAVDGVLNVDDAAVGRHEELQQLAQKLPADDPLAELARQHRWTYIHLGGDVAILSSGAGLTMTIVDLLHQRGVRPANFLDTAQFDEQGIYEAFELLRQAPVPKVWLVNIFAGLNRCDRLAEGICRYLGDQPIAEPLVIRMVGSFEDEGHAILRQAGIAPVRRLEEAIERCAALLEQSGGSR